MEAESVLKKLIAAPLLLGAIASAPCSAQNQSAPATGDGIVLSSDAPPPPQSPSNRLIPQAVRVAEHLEPAIPRPEQERATAEKLAAFEKRTGRKPSQEAKANHVYPLINGSDLSVGITDFQRKAGLLPPAPNQ